MNEYLYCTALAQRGKGMENGKKNDFITIAVAGSVIIAVILIFGTIILGKNAGRDTEKAVKNVSLLYLNELAGRREQVVASILENYKNNMDIAVGLLEKSDLASIENLQQYQARMKQLYNLEKFAFIDTNGLIYTSRGTRNDIDQYPIDYNNLSEPSIFVKNPESKNKKVVIAVPVDNLPLEGETLTVCFMEIDMAKMIEDVSLESNNNTTFCNIYTSRGESLTNMVLGGLASEDNLLEAMEHAEYDEGYSLEKMKDDFNNGRDGVVSFSYNGIRETLYYVPVHATDWMLTYLVRESVISEQINSISESIIRRSLIHSILTALVLAAMFALMVVQMRRASKAALEKEVSEAEKRVQQQELEEQIALQEELADALRAAEQANRAKSGFVSHMSHEIRTPITAILGMNEMIQRESEDDMILSYSENIRMAGISLLGIINDILDFSKIEAGRMQLVSGNYSLKGLIADLYNLIRLRAEAKGLELGISIDPTLPGTLSGDELRIKQVILNLLTNAVKYTEKGSISLKMTCIEKDENRVKIYTEVSDTGIGIKPEDMDRLFSAFDRLDPTRTRTIEGSGLGLSITRQLLKMMDSDLQVESTYDVGSRFYFEFWQGIADPQEIGALDPSSLSLAPARQQKDKQPFTAPGKRILVVDDTPMNLQVIAGLLKRTKMTIETASSGEECIELFAKNAYDIVFLDYRMPGLDGIETLQKMRELCPEKYACTPIVCLTASVIAGDREKLIAAGFTDYLSKPVNIEEMEDMLRKRLASDTALSGEGELNEQETSEQRDELSLLPEGLSEVKGLDVKTGLEYCGEAEDYLYSLKLFYESLDEKAGQIQKTLEDGDMSAYSLTVHSIKSTLRAVGAGSLSDRAQELETAANDKASDILKRETLAFLKDLKDLEEALSPFM